MDDYRACVAAKMRAHLPSGFDADGITQPLYEWQRDVVRWACKIGRAALFQNCGLGKTRQQLVWADQVARHTGGAVIILAPLAVAEQTCREAKRIGVQCAHVREIDDIGTERIVITNYDRVERFMHLRWAGIVLDESSILKSYTGSYCTMLIAMAQEIPYRLCCTATPAPNDHMELGTHAEFLGVSSRTEMLATYFVHDGGSTQSWRLKGHAVADFWQWVASWAVLMQTPRDLGYDGSDYDLPELITHVHHIETGHRDDGELFAKAAATLNEQRRARRDTMESRCQAVADLVNASPDQWLVWCELNDESDALASMITGAAEVRGDTGDELKASRMIGFSEGAERVLVTKPKIAGFGMNWQNCSHMAFVGLSHSWEQYYQAVRRCWRFGQKRDVHVHIVVTDRESAVLDSITRKQEQADEMAKQMVAMTSSATIANMRGCKEPTMEYTRTSDSGKNWTMHLGDCVETMAAMSCHTIDYSIHSPPFASLYTYSDSAYDMGNAKDHDEFFAQFRHMVVELYRVTRPGRLASFHCMNLPTSKCRDGYIGITDFRGQLIRMFQDCGWIYHSEVCIWKDPVTAMQRTKALGLLHKQIRKDSSMSRQGIPDYLVTMRKPGDNDKPIPHGDDLPVSLWQQYASPIWTDINPSDTLQYRSAREHQDEKHICPLQLEVIRRALHLWSAPGDTVLSPFAGIGSEGYISIQHGRKFIGCELKQSYYSQAVANLRAVEDEMVNQATIFDLLGPTE